MPQVVAGHLARQRRPRPDEAHLAEQDVPDLRQLIEAGRSQDPADAGQPRVVGDLEGVALDLVLFLEFGQAGLRVGHHRPELHHLERTPVQADARLAEDHRTAVDEHHGHAR